MIPIPELLKKVAFNTKLINDVSKTIGPEGIDAPTAATLNVIHSENELLYLEIIATQNMQYQLLFEETERLLKLNRSSTQNH